MSDLSALREQIDLIDDQIIDLISRRFKLTGKIGQIKVDKSLPAHDERREEQIISRVVEKSKELSVNPELIHSIFKIILSETVSNHKKLSGT